MISICTVHISLTSSTLFNSSAQIVDDIVSPRQTTPTIAVSGVPPRIETRPKWVHSLNYILSFIRVIDDFTLSSEIIYPLFPINPR